MYERISEMDLTYYIASLIEIRVKLCAKLQNVIVYIPQDYCGSLINYVYNVIIELNNHQIRLPDATIPCHY